MCVIESYVRFINTIVTKITAFQTTDVFQISSLKTKEENITGILISALCTDVVYVRSERA